jgi:hypothetical protein
MNKQPTETVVHTLVLHPESKDTINIVQGYESSSYSTKLYNYNEKINYYKVERVSYMNTIYNIDFSSNYFYIVYLNNSYLISIPIGNYTCDQILVAINSNLVLQSVPITFKYMVNFNLDGSPNFSSLTANSDNSIAARVVAVASTQFSLIYNANSSISLLLKKLGFNGDRVGGQAYCAPNVFSVGLETIYLCSNALAGSISTYRGHGPSHRILPIANVGAFGSMINYYPGDGHYCNFEHNKLGSIDIGLFDKFGNRVNLNGNALEVIIKLYSLPNNTVSLV